MYEIRKKFKVEYAHQLSTAFSKACSDSIHGHSAEIEVFVKVRNLNCDGMCIDFGEINAIIGEYIKSWDHSLVMPDSFPEDYLAMLQAHNKNLKIVNYNPTAENIAKDIFYTITPLLSGKRGKVSKVIFHETDSGYASYWED